MTTRKGSPFSMYIDEDLKLSLKIIALKQKTTIAEILRELIIKYINENKDKL